jgi:hypothetical protein
MVPECVRYLGANQHPFLMDLSFTTHPNRQPVATPACPHGRHAQI